MQQPDHIPSNRDKTKNLLYDKLTAADRIVNEVMAACSLAPEDKISLLLSNIQIRLHGIENSEDATLLELQDIYVNLIIGVMCQDMLESSDEIQMLSSALRKRIDDFDLYFDQIEKGTFKGPF